MNKELFINGFKNRIKAKLNLTDACAFEILVLAAFLDLSFDEVMANVSTLLNGKGSNDAGMDGIYIDEDQSIMHIFQIKSSEGIGDNILSKFITDYRNIFVYDNSSSIPLNQKVVTALEQYKSIVSSGKILETTLYFIFAGEKSEQNSHIIQRHLDSNEYLEIYDINDLYNKIDSLVYEHRKRKTVKFSFMADRSNISLKKDPQAIISFQIQNIKAVNFRLSALNLCKLLDNEKHVNKRVDTVFSDNIRGFLRYNKTNKNIQNTLESDYSEYFPFLNNGITIIADQVKLPQEMQAGYYPIETVNPVIVNGLQTTSVIYDVYQKDSSKLDGVYVLARLYETNDKEIVDKITDATNTQSPINFRDKISNRDFNLYAKTLFELNEIGYLIKRGDTFENHLSQMLKESVHSDTVLKFWYATFNEHPEIAKNSKSIILEDIYDATVDKNHRLYHLFSGEKDSPIYQQLMEAYKIYKFVIDKRNSAKYHNDLILYADELISYGIYKLNDDYEKSYHKIYETLIKLTEKEKKLFTEKGITYSHNSYFKSAKSKYDLNNELGFIEVHS
jgi:hypothetical protein